MLDPKTLNVESERVGFSAVFALSVVAGIQMREKGYALPTRKALLQPGAPRAHWMMA
jgi:hypothetical protein